MLIIDMRQIAHIKINIMRSAPAETNTKNILNIALTVLFMFTFTIDCHNFCQFADFGFTDFILSN